MLNRNKIISTSLLKLGEVADYNDNRSEIYKVASTLLDNVIDTVASKNDFLFNATTIKLTKFGIDEDTGEIVYNKPIDFLNKIKFVNGLARIENEFIYSDVDNLLLQYCKKIDFSEIPEYMFNYLVYSLATELAETYTQYQSRLSMLNARLEQERKIIYSIEFTPMIRKI